MKSRQVEVQLYGKRFVFNLSDNLKKDEFLKIVEFVREKISRIKSEANDLNSFKLSLLTSINIAEELFSLKKENEKLKKILKSIDSMITPEEEKNQISISFSS